MNQRPKPCFRNKPLVVEILMNSNRLNRTNPFAQTASFALKNVYFWEIIGVLMNGIEAAIFFTQAAIIANFGIDFSF